MRLIRFAPMLVLATQVHAENVLRNASSEVVPQEMISAGNNRYYPLRDEVAMRVMRTPLEVKSAEDVELEELGGLKEEAEARGWRLVQEPGKAWHGKISMRCESKEAYSWCVETKGGKYTFSVYALSREKEMVRIRCTDIRGRKGEIRYEQDEAFEVGPEWVRGQCTFSVVRGPVTWAIETLGEGTLWIDAIQLESGTEATPFQLHPWDQSPPKQIEETFSLDDPKPLRGLAPVAPAILKKGGLPGVVRLHASVPAGAPERVLPISGGLPLPRGHVFDERRLSLVDSAGKPLPSQFRVLSRHVLDGSIQMVLVDTLAASPDSTFQLSYGPEVRRADPPTSLKVAEQPESIVVSTGPLKFVVKRKAYTLFDGLWFDQNRDGKFTDPEQLIEPGSQENGPWTADPLGRMYWGSRGPVESVEVEEAGPVRACIAAIGSHRSKEGHILFRYRVRIHAYAGQPFVRIEHVFSNEQPPYSTIMTGAGLRLALKRGRFDRARFNPEVELPVEPGREAYLVHPDLLRRWHNDEVQVIHRKGEGWVTVSGKDVALTATIREWDWMPPKELWFAPDHGLDLCIWPRHQTRGFCVPMGVARTHRMWLWFHRPSIAPKDRTKMLALFKGESLAEADPSWYCQSDVFGPIAHRDAERFPAFETMIKRPGEERFGRFPRPGEYGWRHFITYGDDRGDMGWGNMETMVDHSLFLLYIRSLEPWYYRRAHDAAVHYRDVDVCHPWGQCRVHCHNHTLYPWDGSHSWIKGVLDHYLLTGDPRSLEVAHEHGRWIRTKPVHYEVRKGTRRFTRLVENLADLYRFTGHREYLENFIARVEKAEELRGDRTDISRFGLGNLYRRDPPAPSYGAVGFPQFYAFEALMQMAKATEDERWKKMFQEEMAYVTAAERGRKGLPPDIEAARRWGGARGQGMIESDTRNRVYLPCLNYLYELTKDRRYIEAARYAAFYATTDDRWKDWWPNISWGGLVWFAFGLYYPMQEGWGAKEEVAVRVEARRFVLRTDLRDAGFEETGGSGYNAWANSNTRTNAGKVYDITKDFECKVEGKCSLSIREKEKLPKLDRKKAFDFPLSLSRQKVFLEEPGFYELSGFLKFWKHGRPDVSLSIDGDSGERRDIELNLRTMLPERDYDDIKKAPKLSQDTMKVMAGGDEEKTIDAETLFEGPKEEDNPEDHWWKFRVAFQITETSVLRVKLHYHMGHRWPGGIWYDSFKLRRLEKRPPSLDTATLKMQ